MYFAPDGWVGWGAACLTLPSQKKTFASAIKRLWSKKTVQPWYLECKNTKTVFS